MLALSANAAAALIYCYQAQPDELAGLTIVPACLWLVPAWISVLLFGGRSHKTFTLTVLGLWMIFLFTCVEEVRSLLRREPFPTPTWQAARNEERLLRVVSINCHRERAEAAAQVATHKPDIILFQESPSEEELQKLTTELFGSEGSFVWAGDVSIAARGKVEAKLADESSFFVHASIQLPNGNQVEAVCLHLESPTIRHDFWTGDYWKTYEAERAARREQVKQVMDYVLQLPATAAVVLGGDFNAAPEDGALALLRLHLTDTFAVAGRAWGNTFTESYPVERLDQVWTNAHLRPEWVEAHPTEHTDHRLVVCDVSLPPAAAE